MGDMGELWRDHREATNRIKAKRDFKNRRTIAAGPWPFSCKPSVMIFRVHGKPNADFYPSTDKWVSCGKTYKGGARKFLTWYGEQGENND